MKLRAIALSNIKHNLRKYAMYFFSLCFAVFTAYAFIGLMNNESVSFAYNADSRYKYLLMSFGLVIGVFVFFFMLNANNSFIRARKKEISMYSLFGMPSGKIGKLLFLETMIIGIAALVVGIGLGMFFSKFTAMVLIKMAIPEYSGEVTFSVNLTSMIITMGIFVAFFSALGLSGLRVINKFELVDLFKGEKVSEGKPKGSWILLIISLVLTGYGYYLATSADVMKVVNSTLIILALVILGTYLFFVGGFPKVINIIKRNKKSYYRPENLISVSSFAHRIRSVGTMMATIAVLSAVATTAIATGFTLYTNTEQNTYSMIGYDLYFYGNQEEVLDDIYKAFENNAAEVKDKLTVQRYIAYPKVEEIQLDDMIYFNREDLNFRVYSQSEYNNLINISKTDIKPVSLDGKYDALYVRTFIPTALLGKVVDIEVVFPSATATITKIQECSFLAFGSLNTLVLKDSLFEELLENGEILDYYGSKEDKLDKATVINYSKSMSKKLNEELNSILSGNTTYRLAYSGYSEGLRIFGLVRFIGFFMSAIVILMTASMLYFKQIMAAEEEKHLYRMLRKIGMDDKTQKKVVLKRLLPVFIIPLLVGIIHSIFAMKTADTLVFSDMIISGNSYLSVLGFSSVMYAFYALVYVAFYLIAKSQYMRVIKS